MPAPIPGNRVATQVRLDSVTWKKIKIIAQREDRNANAQLNHFMQQAVAAYEREHGIIDLASDEP